jgi:hypothetical protein
MTSKSSFNLKLHLSISCKWALVYIRTDNEKRVFILCYDDVSDSAELAGNTPTILLRAKVRIIL